MKIKHLGYLLACGALFGSTAWAGDVDKLVETCGTCHGKAGVNSELDVPTIGGSSAEYLKTSLTEYKNKERPCLETKVREGAKKDSKTDMCQVVSELTEADIQQLAAHFAAQKFERSPQTVDATLAAKGQGIHDKNCEKCHSEGGSLASDDAAILAGQKIAYLEQALKQLSEGKRPMNKKMKPKIEALDSADLQALVHFYGSAH